MTHTRNQSASATHPSVRPLTRLSPGDAQGRARRARTDAMAIRPLRDGRYAVETEGGTYVVALDARTCTCPDSAIRGARCKHLRRVAIEITEGRVPPPDKRTAVCAVCGDPTFVDVGVSGSQLCERHAPTPGDLVRDRESGKLLVVTRVTTERADERVVPASGETVAEYETNRHYGDHEPVVEAVYAESLRTRRTADGTPALDDLRTYGFPASRLVALERDLLGVDTAAVVTAANA